MPGFDRTGPMGAGPMTGGGRGLCGSWAGAGRRFYGGFTRGVGRGGIPWGGGMGRCFGGRGGWWGTGPGWGRGFFGRASYGVPFTKDEEADVLKTELASAKDEIAAMEARLAELEKEK
jgi:hypothetical protein